MYGKIFESMYEGTLYGQWEALVTMQQLIVLADADGVIDMTPPALSARTSIPIGIIEKGLDILSKPDPYSRTPGDDGVRIKPIDDHRPWGWYIVNYAKYRDMASAEDVRRQNRERKRRQRERERDESQNIVTGHGSVTDRHSESRMSRHTDTDTDTDTDKPKSKVAAATGFDAFWEVYPKKRKKKQALDIWKRKNLHLIADALRDDVKLRLTGDLRWLKGYVPDPTTYLNGERWNDEFAEGKTSREKTYAEQIKDWIDANAAN